MDKLKEYLHSNNINNFDWNNLHTEEHLKSRIIEDLSEKINNDSISLINIEEEFRVLMDTKTLLETLKNYKLAEKKDFILNIINKALEDIFNGGVYIDIQAQEKKTSNNVTQKYDIIFYQNGIELARNEEILKSNGGGIMQVISTLFKILIGFIYSKNKFYIFDESFSQISGENRLRLSKFLSEFSKKFGFTLIVVSHTQELDEFAHRIYEVESTPDNTGVNTLRIIQNDIKDPELNETAFQVEIENFQSIKKVNLVLSGFTIIRGRNNSGKSAILRAITSILYNTFDIKKYPRISINQESGKVSQLNSSIILEKLNLDGSISDRVALKFKRKKIYFIIDNEEYFGKNLASGKLQEAIEKLGFKYIKTKEFYKNFKGNLKDQTERIASTTQYDSLFLIGGKANDTEKIFNFLFNTELISLAIVKVKEDIKRTDEIFNEIDNNILANTQKINEFSKLLKGITLLKNYIGIQEYLKITSELEKIKGSRNILSKKIELIDAIIPRAKHIIFINNSLASLKQLKEVNSNSSINLNILKDKNIHIDEILKRYKSLYFIEASLEAINKNKKLIKDGKLSIDSNRQKLFFLDEIIKKQYSLLELYQAMEFINEIKKHQSKIKEDKEKIKSLSEYLSQLEQKYKIKVCPTCNGIGHIEHDN